MQVYRGLRSSRRVRTSCFSILFAIGLSCAASAEEEWRELIQAGKALEAFRAPTGAWNEVGRVELVPSDPAHLQGETGQGQIVNDPPGRTTNLVTVDQFADVEIHLEFLVPKSSNSGIKLMGLYEVQIFDSYGVSELTGSDHGGIYPRAELLPKYRHIDGGYPPRMNASKPAGEWQTLKILFRAPRFDAEGKKTANARFEQVELNGERIHTELEVPYPTGHAWNTRKEVPRGPILLQADHGPVAFRSLRVRDPRPLSGSGD